MSDHDPASGSFEGPGLYLHVPFCSAICPYCDFAVLTGGAAKRRRFVDHLCAEMALAVPFPGPFDTVYLGGGTPSALAAEDLGRVFEALRERLPLRASAWTFLEANPEDVTAESLAAWRRLGVATLSLGLQSFDDEALRFLGRRHSGAQGRLAVERAMAAGFEAVSIDLIYGLPGQTVETWRRDLETAVALAPDHLSCYQLTIHQGTAFGTRLRRGQLAELPEDAQGDLFRVTHQVLADAGYPAYEVSNFARAPEHQSRHNRKYWRHVPYLGLGPSAHSFAGRERWWNHAKLSRWEAAVAAGERPIAGQETLSACDLAFEALLLGVRTAEGVDLAAIERRFGVSIAAPNTARIEALASAGLCIPSGPRLIPTLEGLAVADGLAAGFTLLPAEEDPL